MQRPNCVNFSSAALYSNSLDNQSGKLLLLLLPMTVTSSVAEYNDDGLYYPGSLFADITKFCPGPTHHHPNNATHSQKRDVANERHNQPENCLKAKWSSQLSLVLINACSILERMHFIRLLAPSSNYDLLLLTETWLSDDTPNDAIAIPKYKPFRKLCTSQRESDCLVYVRNLMPPSLCHDPQLSRVQDSIWLGAEISGKHLLGCIYRPPGPCRNHFLILTDAMNYCSILPGPEFVARDFNAADICWSDVIDTNC